MRQEKAARSGGRMRRASAVELGSHAVKLATVSLDEQGRVVLEDWTSVPVDGEVGDTQAQLRSLRTALARHRDIADFVVSMIPRQRAIVRYVTLPSVVPAEIDEIMALEVERHSPIPADEMEVGYQVVAERGGTESDVLMVAGSRADLTRHLEILRQADIEPEVIEVAGMNVGRTYMDERRAGEAIAIVDIGRTQTTVSVWHQGFTRFSRSVPWGSERLHEYLQGGDRPISLADLDGMAEDLYRHPGWDLWSKRFSMEMRRTFAAYEHDKGGTHVRRVQLCGGLAGIEAVVLGLRRSLPYEIEVSRDLGAEVRRAEGVEPPGPALADCVGTAIRAVELGRQGINLLPQAVLSERRGAQRRQFLRNCGLLGLAVVLLLAGTAYLQWLGRYRQIQELDLELAEITPRVRMVKTQKDKIDLLLQNVDKEHSCFRVFQSIYTALPDGSNISQFEFYKQDTVRLRGDVFTDNDVLALGEILRTLPHFKSVEQGPIKRKPIAGTGIIAREYEFTCTLVSKPERTLRGGRRGER